MLCIFTYDSAFQNFFNWFPIRVHIRLPNHAKILRKSTIRFINYLTQHNIHEMKFSSKLHNWVSLKSPSISTVWMHKYVMLWLLFLKKTKQICKSHHFCYQTPLYNPDNLALEKSCRFPSTQVISYSQIKLLSHGLPYLLMTFV